MAKSGWEFIEPARRRGARFVRACVRIDDVFGEIPIGELQSWLERMEFFDDESNAEWIGDITPARRIFDFQIWDEDGRLWCVGGNHGLAVLRWVSATPESWLHELRTSPYETGLSEMPSHIVRDEREDGPSYFARRPGETVPQFAERMFEIIKHAKVVVEIEAGHTVDIDFALEEVQEIVDGNAKGLAVRRVRKELDFARKHFPRLDIPAYPSDVDVIETALRLIAGDEAVEQTLVDDLAEVIIADTDKWNRLLPPGRGRLDIQIAGLPAEVIERLNAMTPLNPRVKIEMVARDGQNPET